LRSSIAGFYNQIDDLIRFNSAAGHQRFENLTDAEAKGVEFGLDGFWPGGVRGRISYAYQETEDRATGRVLTDSPQHLGKFNLSVPLLKEKIFASLEYQFTSERTTTRITPAGTIVAGKTAGSFGVVNFTAFSRNLIEGMELSAGVYNLFDQKYGDPSTPFHQQDIIEQDGRTFRV